MLARRLSGDVRSKLSSFLDPDACQSFDGKKTYEPRFKVYAGKVRRSAGKHRRVTAIEAILRDGGGGPNQVLDRSGAEGQERRLSLRQRMQERAKVCSLSVAVHDTARQRTREPVRGTRLRSFHSRLVRLGCGREVR
eukprot:767561-Hanusia_phi.AAC.3